MAFHKASTVHWASLQTTDTTDLISMSCWNSSCFLFSTFTTAGEQLATILVITLHILYLKIAIKSPLKFLFSRLSNPNSLNLSSVVL